MRLFGREIEGHAKLLVILCTVLLVCSGLCGLQMTMFDQIYRGSGVWNQILTLLGLLELAGMVLSLGGILLVLVAWVYSAVSGSLYERYGNPPQDGMRHVFDLRKRSGEVEAPPSEEMKENDDDTTG